MEPSKARAWLPDEFAAAIPGADPDLIRCRPRRKTESDGIAPQGQPPYFFSKKITTCPIVTPARRI